MNGSSELRVGQVRKQAREYLDDLQRRLRTQGTVLPDQVERAATLASRAKDRVLEARAAMLLAAGAPTHCALKDALAHLSFALQTFEANMLTLQASLVRVEAADLLLAAGNLTAAIAMLAAVRDAHMDSPDDKARLNEVRASVLLAQRRLPEAVAAGRRALEIVATERVSHRTRNIVVPACAEVLLAQRLSVLGLETHLSQAAALPRTVRPAGVDTCVDVARWLSQNADLGLEVNALLLLEESATTLATPELLFKLRRLTIELAASPAGTLTRPWLLLGTSYRLAGHGGQALRALQWALELSRNQGRTQDAGHALFELSLVHAAAGDHSTAYEALRDLHRLNAEVPESPVQSLDDVSGIASSTPAVQSADEATAGASVVKVSPHIKRARTFIHEHLGTRLAVTDIAKHCAVSRRTLELAFRATMNTTVSEYVRKMRLQAVVRRLQHTSHAIKLIAHDLGYGSASSLSRDFRRIYGIGPAEYRLRHAAD